MTHSLKEVRLKPLLSFAVVFGLLLAGIAPLLTPGHASAADSINVWWPTDGAHVTGTQPFKAMVPSMDVGNYEMFWRVDGGNWVPMGSDWRDYPHKEASVDVSGWAWHGSGPYVIDFSAKSGGSEIAKATVKIYIDNGLPGRTEPSAQPSTAPAPVTTTATETTSTFQQEAAVTIADMNATIAQMSTQVANMANGNPLSGMKFYVDSNSAAANQMRQWQSGYTYGADLMRQLAGAPTAAWFGNWNGDIAGDVRSYAGKARSTGATPVLVAYNIPARDCGGYSAGGSNSPDGYRDWINKFAEGLGGGRSVVILEPDSLSQIGCLSSNDQNTRYSLLSYAAGKLKSAGANVYLDGGHSGWIDAPTMADRLARANVAAADGFALNVSNFVHTSFETSYGSDISGRVGGKHFVIDTSRNGRGAMGGQWCNPWGTAIGTSPTTSTGNSLVDAYLWLKVPGESDGYCNGGPSAGSWWPDFAVSLVQNAR